MTGGSEGRRKSESEGRTDDEGARCAEDEVQHLALHAVKVGELLEEGLEAAWKLRDGAQAVSVPLNIGVRDGRTDVLVVVPRRRSIR